MGNGRSGWGKALRYFAVASTISIQFAASVVVGWWLGNYLDQRWHTAPWLGLLGLLVGIGAGILGIVRLLTRMGANNQS
ncbi:AtpZ/AtpI family protein [Desulfothermobacter acidiphilus]|uniref:AtpZ/AtpI family protein n=1 Tax=Desulfothermobacter acidiphilus TaxID=1938353 RepID=UPI003F8A618D